MEYFMISIGDTMDNRDKEGIIYEEFIFIFIILMWGVCSVEAESIFY